MKFDPNWQRKPINPTNKGEDMKRKEKVKILTYVAKFFSILTYISTWYATAQEDEVIEADELIELGAGICGILGLKTSINLTPQDD